MDDVLILRVAARYKSKKTVKTKDGDDMVVYEYSDRQVAKRHSDKAKRYESLTSSIDKLRKQVKSDFKSSDPKKKLTALAVALIDHTFERVGNDDSADEGHFGVTGWQRRHISFGKGGATVKYVGKSGVQHEKKISDSGILKALKEAYEAVKGDKSCLFEQDEACVKASDVNAYLKDFDITAKDLRGYHANREMRENLRRARKGKLPEDKREREKKLKEEFKEALEATAEAVGHEPNTLANDYLVTGLKEAYLLDGSILDDLTDRTASCQLSYL